MTGKQHLTFGIVTGIAFSAYLQKINICQTNADMVYVVCGSIIGNLLPDIDSTESMISKMVPPITTLISKIINNIFGHRGLLHYSVFWLILGILIAKYNHFFLSKNHPNPGIPLYVHASKNKCPETPKNNPCVKSFYIFPKKWKMYVGKPRTNVVSGILTIGVTLVLAYMSFRTK